MMGVGTATISDQESAVSTVAGRAISATRYDLAVIGGDPAGLWAAQEAIHRKKRVALIVRPSTGLGDPIHAWAVDSALREAGRVARRLAGGAVSGVTPTGAGQIEFRAMIQWVGQTAARLASCPSPEQLAQSGVDRFVGQTVFTGLDTLSVDGHPLRFRRAILAADRRHAPTSIPGAVESECLMAEAIPSLESLPRRLAVAGAGPRACQWAQTFSRLGSEVYLIDPSPHALPGEEPDLVRLIQTQLESDGVRLNFGCQALELQRTGNQRVLVIQRDDRKEKLFVDQILLDTPSVPDLEGLRLDAAGVMCADFRVVVNDRLQTSNRRIFAAGVACGARFAGPEVAEALARLVVHNAFAMWPWSPRPVIVPRWIGTDPEVAAIGWTPSEAAAADVPVDVYQADLAQADRAVLEGGKQGFVKAYVDRMTGRLVGVCVAGEEAGELMGPLSILLAQRLPLSAMATVIPCRPTRFEALQRLAVSQSNAPRPSWCARALGKFRKRRTPQALARSSLRPG